MALIECKKLCVGYDGKVVLPDIDFSLKAGDYLCIIGENGSGKSTLMKTLLGLLKPISGEIVRGDGFVSGKIGYLPQQTDVQKDFPATVFEIVVSGFQGSMGLRPFYNKSEIKEAEKNIGLMGISHLKSRCYRELSGGQKQRVLLARALCATKELLLLDEPVTGLDIKASSEMYELVESLNKNGTAIIMVSHDFDAAMKYATHILHIGKKVFFGTKEEYLASDAVYAFGGVKNADN